MATNVGQVRAEFVGDSTKLVQAANQATSAVTKFATAASQSATKASQAVEQTAKSTQQAASGATQAANETATAAQKAAQAAQQAGKAVTKAGNDAKTSARKVEQSMEDASNATKKASSSMSDFADKASSVGRSMTMKVTAPMVATGVGAVLMANKFEFSMASITGLVGIAADEVKAMEGQVRSMAVEFGRSAPEAAEALYFVTSAGIKGADAMSVLEASLMAAAVGLGETMVIADTVSSALNAYGIENLSAAQATDLMVAAVREGKMEADALAGALPRVLPIASAMSVSFEEVGAAFAAMSRNGTDANEAATQIRGILSSLLNPTKQAEEQLAALGLTSAGLRKTIREDGLLVGLKQLTDAFGNNEEAAGVVFGNIRALTGVMSLFGAATESTETIFENLTDNAGDLDKAFTAMSDTGTFKANQALAAMKDAMISLGQVLVPIVLPIFKAVTSAISTMTNALNSLPKPVKTVIVVLGGLLAATGPLLIAFGAMAKAWLALKAAMTYDLFLKLSASASYAMPYLVAAAAAVAAIVVVYSAFSGASEEARQKQEQLTQALRDAGDPTALLVQQTSDLVDEYLRMKGAASDAATATATGADAFTLGQLTASGFNDDLTALGFSIGDITDVVRTGTDDFGDLAHNIELGTDAATRNEKQMADTLVALDTYSYYTNSVIEALKGQYVAGEITGQQLIDTLNTLDQTSDAWDNHREAMEADAKAMLTNTDQAARLASVLGADVYNELLNNALATADAAGRADRYSYALEIVNAEVLKVTEALRAETNATEEAGTAAVVASTGIETLAQVFARLAGLADDGKVSLEAFYADLGLLDEFMSNKLMNTFDDALEANGQLVDGFLQSGDAALDFERAARTQAEKIGELVYKTGQMQGSMEQVAPVIAAMVQQLVDAGANAGLSTEYMYGLIESMGILNGFKAKFGIEFALNADQLRQQIAAIEAQIGELMGDAAGRGSSAMRALREQLFALKAVQQAISGVRPTKSSGGGGGGRAPKKSEEPNLDWIEGWVKSMADFTNDVISEDFAQALMDGSAEEIADGISKMFQKASELNLENVPGFAALKARIESMGAELASLANVRDALEGGLKNALEGTTNRITGESTQGLYDLRDALDAVSESANKFDIKSGRTSPTLTLLEQAQEAEKKYDQLYADLQAKKSERESFAQGVVSAVNAPLEAGRNPFAQTQKILANARQFRDNLVALRDRGFGADIIREVVSAGVIDGNRLAKSLLSMSGSEMESFLAMRTEIASLATEAGNIAGDVLFSGDIAGLEAALQTQAGVVANLYANAVAEAQAQFDAQQQLVASLEQELAGVNESMADLIYAIQTSLHDTMFGFLAGFQDGINQLVGAPTRASIPAMAAGGVVTRPTVLLAGEAGPEAIMPLSQAGLSQTGGMNVYVNIEGSVTSERDLIESVRVGLLKAQKSGRQVVL